MNIYRILGLIVSLWAISCSDDFDFKPIGKNELKFSKDTVYLDTIFSTVASSTYTLKVYNATQKGILIPSIELQKGENSLYNLMIDGLRNKAFKNIEIKPKDSLFVFITTNVDIKQHTSEKEFLYTDKILFKSAQSEQSVDLVTLVYDAVFLSSDGDPTNKKKIRIGEQEVEGFYLKEADLDFSTQKPTVIHGYAIVPQNKIANINAGGSVFLHQNSGIVVEENATLNIKGEIQNPIVIQGNRLEPDFENISGQWDGIYSLPNGNINIENAIVKNAKTALNIQANAHTAKLHNLQLYNCANNGIYGSNANILGSNIVINNCGNASLYIGNGGNYNFIHCTFANYWNKPFYSVITINDSGNTKIEKARFINSIIYGGLPESLKILTNNQPETKVSFEHSLIRFLDPKNHLYNQFPYLFGNQEYFKNCLIERTANEYYPYFYNVSKNQMMITSKATTIIGYGTPNLPTPIATDINGKIRSTDLGAYNWVE